MSPVGFVGFIIGIVGLVMLANQKSRSPREMTIDDAIRALTTRT